MNPIPKEQIRFGLIPVLDSVWELQRTVLPLKSIRYHFVARGGLVEVQLTQVYHQENPQPLDCDYLFPLPADAAVHRCEAVINGRVLRARIEERDAARALAKSMKAAGRRTALVESERDNLFRLSLGNVQPEDVVEVTLAYLQPLRRQGRQVTLDLPLCPGVRYIPGRTLLRSNRGHGLVDDTDQVPDASRITPPRIDGTHPDAAFIELHGQVDSGFVEGSVSSPSHAITITPSGSVLNLALARGGEVPDRDLSLRWQEQETATTALRGWKRTHNGHAYTLIELRAPERLESIDAVPQDVYFLVDRSGSMQGMKWQKSIEALHACVEVLGPSDRIWVTLFESSFIDFDAKPQTPSVLLADPRFRDLASIGTGGGTEMGPALSHVLEAVQRFSHNRPAVLVLITDAEIGNEQEIVRLLSAHPELPVHCFGIDTTLNDSLLLDLVRQQGGTFHSLQPGEDVAGRVQQLGRTLRQPVWMNLTMPPSWELASEALPNLYAGQILLISARTKVPLDSNRLRWVARDHRNQAVQMDIELTTVAEASPVLRWSKERLVSLSAKDDQVAAIALSCEANLICPFTAFVAWDEEEQVAVASHQLVQPCLEEMPLFSQIDDRSLARFSPGFMSLHLGEESKIDPMTKRIQELIQATSELPRATELADGLQRLLNGPDRSHGPSTANVVTRALDDCENDLEEWLRLWERLKQLDPVLAKKLKVTRRTSHTTRNPPPHRASLYDRVREALSRVLAATTRKEIEATVSELDQIEVRILKRIELLLAKETEVV